MSSFFLKGKPKTPLKRKYDKPQKSKESRKNNNLEKAEESSESELDFKKFSDKEDTDSENETVEDKKLRLARKYLDEIKKEEQKKAELKEVSDDTLAERLKKDILEQQGKLRVQIADRFSGVNVTYSQIRCKEHSLSITCITLSLDGEYLFSGSKCSSVVKWNLKEKKKYGNINYKGGKLKGAITCLALSSDFKYLATSDSSPDIHIWDPVNLHHLHCFKGHKNRVTGIVFRKGFHDLYSASEDRTIKLWSLDEKAYIETLFGHQSPITSIDALTRERAITSGGRDTTLRIWKIVEESQLIFNGPQGSCDAVKLIDEEHFVSGHEDGSLCIWSVLKKKPLSNVLNAHGLDSNGTPRWICSLATLVNSDIFASGSYDGRLIIWKIEETFRKISQIMFVDVNGFINSIVISPGAESIIVGIGQEHKNGRWWRNKNAKNSIAIISFHKS